MIYSGTHGYDAAGQLSGETLLPGLVPTVVDITQTYDTDNRLLTHNGAATTFDADGNLLTIAAGVAPASYTYDARNRLTSAGGLTYGYDAENRRVAVTDSTGTTSYVINPNATLDQVLVRTASDGTKTFYVYGIGLLHEETGTAVSYYHHDRRGDTVAITDDIGTVTDRASYGIYGELLSRTGTTDTPFLFNGRWGVQTDGNGLYYHRARYYHPELRRFLNQDLILGSIGSPASLNRFAYVNGNPVSNIDPFGLMAMDAAPNSGGPSLGQQFAQGAYALIPGAVAYDNMRANWAAGNTATAVANGVAWIGEQALFVATLGQSMTTQAGTRAITTTVAGAESTTLFRAVSPAELADLGATGVFRNPLGAEVKYFSTTAAGAASYARQTVGTGLYQGPYTIVRTGVQTNLVNSPLLRTTVDRGIPTIVVPTQTLPRLAPPVTLPATPVPPRLPTVRVGPE